MSTPLLVRRAALVICFCLSLGLPSRTASADGGSYCDATFISGDQFFRELKEVNVAVNADPLIAKIISADNLRKRVADALGPYNITVRDQAPVTLFVEVDDSPRDIKRTMTYSDGSRTEEVYHCHVIYCEMAFFVRATALRNGKFHLLAASAMYSSNIFTLQQQTGIGKLLLGDDISAELKGKLQLNLADRMKFFATPGPADNPEPWLVDNWSDQQKSTMNDAYTAFIKSDPKIEKRPIDGLDTAPQLKLTAEIKVEGIAADPSWKKLWQSECENLGLVKPADPPALVIRHYFGCEVNHHPAFQAFDDMFDEIVLRESNLVFNFNGRLVRKQGSIFSYHRSMVAGKDDLNSVTDNYLLRSLKEFEANLRAGDQPLPAMEAPSTSPPKDITKQVALGMSFARIEPGMFLMGSPETEAGRTKGETQHAVKLTKPFYLATHDVTRAQFAVFVADANFKTDAEKANDENTWQHNKVFEQEETCPVVNVSWSDAVAFIAWEEKEGRKPNRPWGLVLSSAGGCCQGPEPILNPAQPLTADACVHAAWATIVHWLSPVAARYNRTGMQSIDVHDLPEAVARAIESMVQSIRRASDNGNHGSAPAGAPTLAQALGPILAEIDNMPNEPGHPQLKGQEAEIQDLIVEKFRKQGLKL